jgi:hypothetical protein
MGVMQWMRVQQASHQATQASMQQQQLVIK